ncbi:MAG: FadR family transcriptional regulator [Planctomycetes bacterium]|nr:FadR family transcriptional regulator [Planctomycetota bacterium]
MPTTSPRQRPARRRPRPVGVDTLERLKRLIGEGRYQPGSALPAERELAATLGVSRPSLREALRMLAALGAIETRHGSGTRVSATSAGVLRASFEFLLLLDRPTIDDLLDARGLIEGHLATRAAMLRDDDDLAALNDTAAIMHANAIGSRAGIEANRRFHQTIAAAARSTVLERFMACLDDGIRACIESGAATANTATSHAAHDAILAAITAGDADAARVAVAEHMRLSGINAGSARTRPVKRSR